VRIDQGKVGVTYLTTKGLKVTYLGPGKGTDRIRVRSEQSGKEIEIPSSYEVSDPDGDPPRAEPAELIAAKDWKGLATWIGSADEVEIDDLLEEYPLAKVQQLVDDAKRKRREGDAGEQPVNESNPSDEPASPPAAKDTGPLAPVECGVCHRVVRLRKQRVAPYDIVLDTHSSDTSPVCSGSSRRPDQTFAPVVEEEVVSEADEVDLDEDEPDPVPTEHDIEMQAAKDEVVLNRLQELGIDPAEVGEGPTPVPPKSAEQVALEAQLEQDAADLAVARAAHGQIPREDRVALLWSNVRDSRAALALEEDAEVIAEAIRAEEKAKARKTILMQLRGRWHTLTGKTWEESEPQGKAMRYRLHVSGKPGWIEVDATSLQLAVSHFRRNSYSELPTGDAWEQKFEDDDTVWVPVDPDARRYFWIVVEEIPAEVPKAETPAPMQAEEEAPEPTIDPTVIIGLGRSLDEQRIETASLNPAWWAWFGRASGAGTGEWWTVRLIAAIGVETSGHKIMQLEDAVSAAFTDMDDPGLPSFIRELLAACDRRIRQLEQPRRSRDEDAPEEEDRVEDESVSEETPAPETAPPPEPAERRDDEFALEHLVIVRKPDGTEDLWGRQPGQTPRRIGDASAPHLREAARLVRAAALAAARSTGPVPGSTGPVDLALIREYDTNLSTAQSGLSALAALLPSLHALGLDVTLTITTRSKQ
jgi:hypothetical protein